MDTKGMEFKASYRKGEPLGRCSGLRVRTFWNVLQAQAWNPVGLRSTLQAPFLQNAITHFPPLPCVDLVLLH